MTVTAKNPAECSANNAVCLWKTSDVIAWASGTDCRCSASVVNCLQSEGVDGEVLLALNEDDIRDFRYKLNYNLNFGECKKLWLAVRALQLQNVEITTGVTGRPLHPNASPVHGPVHNATHVPATSYTCACRLLTNSSDYPASCAATGCAATGCAAVGGTSAGCCDCEHFTPPMSVDGHISNIPTEFFKTTISLGYSFLVTWITSFVMVIVHERVPDMKRYPPLPDIFLDNVPHIPWAFHMCEITGTLLFTIWTCVCIFHKYRMVLLRRFFALAGTVFLLRCVTMLITSLSVPGTHLQCNQKDYAVDDTVLSLAEALNLRISRAYTIWSGLGMSIQGVRTCGDYMFSGHTVALTLLNFFITEYTPRNLYFLHTLTWLLNMFGIFFILAAHEHYSIDVFVAFYITSRLFLYYHTLANNQALMSRDSTRTRIWFPMFSYFESSVDGIIPNEYETFSTLLSNFFEFILAIKDSFMLTARRFWIDPPNLAMTSKNMLFVPSLNAADSKHKNAATSTSGSVNVTPTSTNSSFMENEHYINDSKMPEAKTIIVNSSNKKEL